MSQSMLEIKFTFLGTDNQIKGELMRINSPFTIQKLMDKSPISARSRANIGRTKEYWMFLVDIKKGAEGDEYLDYEVGDIVYCPRQDAIFILIEEVDEFNYPVFYLGKVTEGIEIISEMKNGMNARIDVDPIE